MFSWIIQISLISIILIFLVHHLIHFFKTTLTVPKIKDLVHSPNQKYKDIFDTISNKHGNKNGNKHSTIYNNNNYTSIELLPRDLSTTELSTTELSRTDLSRIDLSRIDLLTTDKPSSMKNELKNFLKKQMNLEPKDTFDFTSF